MKTILLLILIFSAVFAALLLPSRHAAEMLWSRDVSSEPPPYFPVLIRSPEGKFIVEKLQNVSPQSSLVTEMTDQDVAKINSDLRSSISLQNSNHAYFRIVGRGKGYTDVSLEVPTTADFPPKGWYRIQNGAIHPQRIVFNGPALALFSIFLPFVAGAIAVWCCNRIMRYRRAQSQNGT
jgi:hypothetical protein